MARTRREANLSRVELARRVGTSRTAVSAYGHGRNSPSLDTVDRLVSSSGYELGVRPRIEFVRVSGGRGRTVVVPTSLPRLLVTQALAVVELPLAVNWSQPGRMFHLFDRSDRARVYEMVLREGGEADILRYIDGVLLVDLWDELVLPRNVRAAWLPLVEDVRGVSTDPIVA